MAKSFREYLRSLSPEKSAIGEFIANAKADKAFPNAESWEELKRHLYKVGANHETTVACRMVWRRYKDELREKP